MFLFMPRHRPRGELCGADGCNHEAFCTHHRGSKQNYYKNSKLCFTGNRWLKGMANAAHDFDGGGGALCFFSLRKPVSCSHLSPPTYHPRPAGRSSDLCLRHCTLIQGNSSPPHSLCVAATGPSRDLLPKVGGQKDDFYCALESYLHASKETSNDLRQL